MRSEEKSCMYTRTHLYTCLCFRTQDQFQCDPDSYNGAVRENYSWSQDYTDVEVRVFVPKTVVKGRQVHAAHSSPLDQAIAVASHSCFSGCPQVSVSLQAGSVRVCARDGAEEKTLLEGEFTHKINSENSLWSLEPGNCVVVSMWKKFSDHLQQKHSVETV